MRVPRLPYVRAKTRLDYGKTFQRLAKSTWNQLGAGVRDTNTPPSETTLTENNLLEIALRHPLVKLHKFTAWEESVSGADWLWWIGDTQRGVLLQIQAKKLSFSRLYDSTYQELIGGHARDQLDKLVADSGNRKAFPLYCFYNSIVKPNYVFTQSGTACCRWPGGVPDPYKLTGCLITSPSHVKSLMNSGTANFENAQRVGVPWDCLVCCSNREFKRMTLAERTVAAIGRLMQSFRPDDSQFMDAVPEPLILDEPPIEIQALLEGATEDLEGSLPGIVSNQQKWDTLGAERSGAGWRSGELPEGPVVASSPFGGLSLHLLPAL